MAKDISSKQLTVLVTGGAGFIGSHVVDRLVADNHMVIVVDDLSAGKRENVHPKAIFYQVNITDRTAMEKIFQAHHIDYCIHEAAKINLNIFLEDPIKDVTSSVISTVNLLQLCVAFHVKKFVYASSVAVYGRPRKLPAGENDPCHPVYSYGIAKQCAEAYVRYYAENYDLPYAILRYANVYGPRQPIYGEVGVIAIFTDRITHEQPITVYGDGEQMRDYIYIDDVVDATLKALTVGENETLNIGCGKGIAVNTLVATFQRASATMLPPIHKSERVGELGKFFTNAEKAMRVLHWEPRIDIEEGIHRTIEYYSSHAVSEKKI